MAIEFRAEAARPRAAIRREVSVPVPGPDASLRIAVRGIGRLGVAHVELTDGTTVLHPGGWDARRARTLGRRAPAEGFPDLDWERNEASIPLRFQGGPVRPRQRPARRQKSGPANAGPL
jgi:hypothetical protein